MLLIVLLDSLLLFCVTRENFVIVSADLLLDVAHCPIRHLDSVTVKEGVEDVVTGNGLIQNAEKFGPDIARDTGVPGRIEPKCSSPPTSALVVTPPLTIVVV